ncbi:hypothetical protein ABTX15_20915 [Micromonospora sp. NPDC094482]|uniref:hypothetical protein n=1 Tax=Micromonospora sp. NPDC094482 TaxID=3155081 RepID=UPI003323ED9E
MPEPQPGADRPADGKTPGTEPDRDPTVAGEGTSSPVPPEGVSHPGPPTPLEPQPGTASGDDGDRRPAEPQPASESASESAGPEGTRPLTEPAADPADPASDDGAASDGPSGTRRLPVAEAAGDPTPPRWSGSAPVPPPPPRRRAWGESAEPTPVPPAPPEPPEHRVPVDPWAGADTGGWELPSAELPPLPPTVSYPAPPPTRPYSGPPAPVPPPPVSPAPHVPPHQVAPRHPAPAPPVARPPVPARPAPPAPPAPPKQRRSKRSPAPPPAAPPPDWRAPKGYVPVRKRRRWPWLLLLTLACCCGCPAYYGMPISAQYPAKASLPGRVADLSLREDSRSEQAARQLETEVRKAHWLAEDTFAGVYTTADGKPVTVFGGTGFRLTPEADADDEITRLTEQYQLDAAEKVDTGVRGRHERCAVGSADGTDVVVCTSVDHGSIATGVFTRLSVQDSAALLDTLRGQIVTAGRN